MKNARYKDHKILKYTPTSAIQKAEDTLCLEHREKFRLFCYTDEKPLCISCNNPSNTKHSTHYVKSLAAVLE